MCQPCNGTELISADATTCVPRRCQKSGGRVVCRKCPSDYISVTQNFDGSPMKEVTCFKCHRGYKAYDNKCVKCEVCSCGRNEMAVSGKCLPKKYVMERPKYSDNKLHPNALLDIVKLEYLCTQADTRACHALARECVKYLYLTDLAGPCRLWLQKNGTYDVDCTKNITDLNSDFGKLFELFIPGENYKAFPISILKPDGNFVQKGSWPRSKFRKIFLIDKILSTTTNMTTIVYLRKLLIAFRIERGLKESLKLYIHTEAHFAIKSPLVQQITTTLLVDHEMPYASVYRGLEIWGAILSLLFCIYALVQWRSVIRRGGLYISIIPLIASATADGIYFATSFSTLHALAAEAGNLGITLPLSQTEENIIKIVLYSVIILKSLKVVWINWNQCRVDVFFIDWLQHHSSISDLPTTGYRHDWRSILLAKEWMEWQAKRRSSPIATVICTLGILQITEQWNSYIPKSIGYKWVIATIVWWFSYTIIFLINWIKQRFLARPMSLLKSCSGAELSLIVFQEEFYAHYVHGRNEDFDSSMNFPGPLATCRVVCATQIRTVYKKLAHNGNGKYYSNRLLLSKFLSAFFERALDGLSWVAIERTLLERLLDVELTNSEGSNVSTLLYDINDNTPSCLALTWWGEEWTLATFDCMLFGSIFVGTNNLLLAAITTILIYQMLKELRLWFGSRNLKQKTGIKVE
ncbi:meckelin-like [Pieris brassicae]|uniref:meckelin-like n=1 Tax=Pieris brassicae TaxID=7116 RepID=UPI001E65EE6B|nr:meckelin-like [Pieris brassicae]